MVRLASVLLGVMVKAISCPFFGGKDKAFGAFGRNAFFQIDLDTVLRKTNSFNAQGIRRGRRTFWVLKTETDAKTRGFGAVINQRNCVIFRYLDSHCHRIGIGFDRIFPQIHRADTRIVNKTQR